MDDTLREEVSRMHAQICSGLADPTRILILYALHEKPHNVTELTKRLDVSQPTISRHLKVLRERQMVNGERDGQAIVYSVADQRVIDALNLLRAVLASQLKNQVALARGVSEELDTDQA